ncbi:uncharacterized protein LOC116611665 isoform X2 [Nematostella vectensis]|nr:uncharacterized protein LOC116611665 isoform X2 [Nematostella vectensis]
MAHEIVVDLQDNSKPKTQEVTVIPVEDSRERDDSRSEDEESIVEKEDIPTRQDPVRRLLGRIQKQRDDWKRRQTTDEEEDIADQKMSAARPAGKKAQRSAKVLTPLAEEEEPLHDTPSAPAMLDRPQGPSTRDITDQDDAASPYKGRALLHPFEVAKQARAVTPTTDETEDKQPVSTSALSQEQHLLEQQKLKMQLQEQKLIQERLEEQLKEYHNKLMDVTGSMKDSGRGTGWFLPQQGVIGGPDGPTPTSSTGILSTQHACDAPSESVPLPQHQYSLPDERLRPFTEDQRSSNARIARMQDPNTSSGVPVAPVEEVYPAHDAKHISSQERSTGNFPSTQYPSDHSRSLVGQASDTSTLESGSLRLLEQTEEEPSDTTSGMSTGARSDIRRSLDEGESGASSSPPSSASGQQPSSAQSPGRFQIVSGTSADNSSTRKPGYEYPFPLEPGWGLKVVSASSSSSIASSVPSSMYSGPTPWIPSSAARYTLAVSPMLQSPRSSGSSGQDQEELLSQSLSSYSHSTESDRVRIQEQSPQMVDHLQPSFVPTNVQKFNWDRTSPTSTNLSDVLASVRQGVAVSKRADPVLRPSPGGPSVSNETGLSTGQSPGYLDVYRKKWEEERKLIKAQRAEIRQRQEKQTRRMRYYQNIIERHGYISPQAESGVPRMDSPLGELGLHQTDSPQAGGKDSSTSTKSLVDLPKQFIDTKNSSSGRSTPDTLGDFLGRYRQSLDLNAHTKDTNMSPKDPNRAQVPTPVWQARSSTGDTHSTITRISVRNVITDSQGSSSSALTYSQSSTITSSDTVYSPLPNYLGQSKHDEVCSRATPQHANIDTKEPGPTGRSIDPSSRIQEGSRAVEISHEILVSEESSEGFSSQVGIGEPGVFSEEDQRWFIPSRSGTSQRSSETPNQATPFYSDPFSPGRDVYNRVISTGPHSDSQSSGTSSSPQTQQWFIPQKASTSSVDFLHSHFRQDLPFTEKTPRDWQVPMRAGSSTTSPWPPMETMRARVETETQGEEDFSRRPGFGQELSYPGKTPRVWQVPMRAGSSTTSLWPPIASTANGGQGDWRFPPRADASSSSVFVPVPSYDRPNAQDRQDEAYTGGEQGTWHVPVRASGSSSSAIGPVTSHGRPHPQDKQDEGHVPVRASASSISALGPAPSATPFHPKFSREHSSPMRYDTQDNSLAEDSRWQLENSSSDFLGPVLREQSAFSPGEHEWLYVPPSTASQSTTPGDRSSPGHLASPGHVGSPRYEASPGHLASPRYFISRGQSADQRYPESDFAVPGHSGSRSAENPRFSTSPGHSADLDHSTIPGYSASTAYSETRDYGADLDTGSDDRKYDLSSRQLSDRPSNTASLISGSLVSEVSMSDFRHESSENSERLTTVNDEEQSGGSKEQDRISSIHTSDISNHGSLLSQSAHSASMSSRFSDQGEMLSRSGASVTMKGLEAENIHHSPREEARYPREDAQIHEGPLEARDGTRDTREETESDTLSLPPDSHSIPLQAAFLQRKQDFIKRSLARVDQAKAKRYESQPQVHVKQRSKPVKQVSKPAKPIRGGKSAKTSKPSKPAKPRRTSKMSRSSIAGP